MGHVKKNINGGKEKFIFKRCCFNHVCRYTKINLLYILSTRIQTSSFVMDKWNLNQIVDTFAFQNYTVSFQTRKVYFQSFFTTKQSMLSQERRFFLFHSVFRNLGAQNLASEKSCRPRIKTRRRRGYLTRLSIPKIT